MNTEWDKLVTSRKRWESFNQFKASIWHYIDVIFLNKWILLMLDVYMLYIFTYWAILSFKKSLPLHTIVCSVFSLFYIFFLFEDLKKYFLKKTEVNTEL